MPPCSDVMLLHRLGMLLQECSKKKASKLGTTLHALVIKIGLDSDLITSNHLINMYAKNKDCDSSRWIFDHMSNRNIVSWSAMISGYDQSGKASMALDLFAQMPLQPNEYIYSSAISACATLNALVQGRQIHAHSLKNGYDQVSYVLNSLMSMYIKCGYFVDAFCIFSSIQNPNSVSYNAMITGFAENFKLDKALELFRIMNQQGSQPDEFSYVALLGICSTMDDLQVGLGLHCQTIKLSLDTTTFVGNVILTMYTKCNLFDEVEEAYMAIQYKDIITYNTYIDASSNCGEPMKGLMVYKEIITIENNLCVSPDEFTTATALALSAQLASFPYGGQIHAHLIRTRMVLDIVVYNAMISMYAKCGCSRYADRVFNLMPSRNLISYNTMINGLGNHGCAVKALEIFKQMINEGFYADSITFIGLLIACSHGGLVDEGLALFNSMEETYGICPRIEHLSCLVDMLGRSGRLVEAEYYIKMSRYQNDTVIWGNLLSSCRLHKDIIVGERAANKLLELQPDVSSPYVLLANLYASEERWEGVAEAWKMLKNYRVKKEPGYSMIEVKGIAEKFTAGDFSHAQIEGIVKTLESLQWITKKFYMPSPRGSPFSMTWNRFPTHLRDCLMLVGRTKSTKNSNIMENIIGRKKGGRVFSGHSWKKSSVLRLLLSARSEISFDLQAQVATSLVLSDCLNCPSHTNQEIMLLYLLMDALVLVILLKVVYLLLSMRLIHLMLLYLFIMLVSLTAVWSSPFLC